MLYALLGVGVVVLLLVLLFFASYKKARPDQALIISGLGKQKAIVGKAGFAIPFLQRVDCLPLTLIQIDVKAARIPTEEYINVNIDAVANVQVDPTKIDVAAKNFLNKPEVYIRDTVREVLEGNTREIIGQMKLASLATKRDEFATKVQENVTDDMSRIGMKVVNFTVQNFTDDNHAIEDLGIDNLAQIQKNAKIAKAQAERDVEVETAKAEQEANKARVEANKQIADQDKDLALKQAANKAESDTAKAKADAAFEIQKQVQQKTINQNQVEAETARAEKQLALKEKEIALRERELDATVKKKADADRYAVEQAAEAEKTRRAKEAEAKRIEMEQEAEGVRAKGKAVADSIRAQKLAEAEGVLKLAEAQKKMGEASIIEMVVNKLPEIAKEIATPLGNVDSITMYDPNGTTKLLEGTTKGIDQVMKSADAAGIDLKGLISGFIGGKASAKDLPIKEQDK